MSEEETQKLLDEASALYNDGRYDEAIGIWNRILEADPGNERATEGIKMANLLTSEWEPGPQPDEEGAAAAAPLDPRTLERIEEGVRRVQSLLEAGDLAGAREGVEALEQVAPDHPGVQSSAARVEAAENPSGFVEEQLAMARHYLMLGDSDEVARVCRRVLAVDANSAAAREMLSSAEEGGPPADDPAPPGEAPLELSLDHEEPVEPLGLDPPGEEAAPAAPAAPAAAGSVGEEDAKIAALLAEGDELQAQGKHEEAIDAWSRIFIIQDSHSGAEARIDGARRALDERGRKMEEHLVRAGDLENEGRLEEARDELGAVLALRAGHKEAQARLEKLQARIDAGEEGPEAIPLESPLESTAPAEPPPPGAGEPAPPREAAPIPQEDEDDSGVAPTPKPPPRPPQRFERVGGGAAAKRTSPVVLILAAVVVAGGLAYAGWLGWQRFFPETPADGPAAEPAPAANPSGAKAAGKRQAPPAGEGTAEEGSGAEPAPSPPSSEPSPDLTPEEARARSAELLRTGLARFEAGDHAAALARFEEALKLDPTNFEARDRLGQARAEVDRQSAFDQEMVRITELFAEKDFRNALYKLYRVETPDPEAQDRVDRWIHACWYDWGVQEMKAGDAEGAAEKFQEVLDAFPSDQEAKEHLEVAERYGASPVDASFRAYAAQLRPRPLP